MFEVTDDMYKALLDVGKDHYLKNKSVEFANQYRDRCTYVGYNKIEEFMHLVWEKSEHYNFLSDKEYNILAMIMCFWGCDFDNDPQYPWARLKRFTGTRPAPQCAESEVLQTLTAVYHKFYQMHQRIVGKNFLYIITAYENITKLNFNDFSHLQGDSSTVALLAKIYPAKYSCMSEHVFYAGIIPAAQRKSCLYHLDSRVGTAILAALIFMYGISFDIDPLYFRLNKILAGDSLLGMQKEQILLAHVQALAADNLHRIVEWEEYTHDGPR